MKWMLVRQNLYVLCAVQLGKLIRHPARYIVCFVYCESRAFLLSHIARVCSTRISYDAVKRRN